MILIILYSMFLFILGVITGIVLLAMCAISKMTIDEEGEKTDGKKQQINQSIQSNV